MGSQCLAASSHDSPSSSMVDNDNPEPCNSSLLISIITPYPNCPAQGGGLSFNCGGTCLLAGARETLSLSLRFPRTCGAGSDGLLGTLKVTPSQLPRLIWSLEIFVPLTQNVNEHTCPWKVCVSDFQNRCGNEVCERTWVTQATITSMSHPKMLHIGI